MDLYAVMRRSIGKPEEISEMARRSDEAATSRADQVRRIRTYLLAEPGGRVGTVCLYQAISPEAIFEHGRAADIPVDEVVKVAGVDVVRPDPAT